jgi:hypothetical protein
MDKITAVMASWEAFLLAFAAFAVIGVLRQVGTRKDAKGNVTGGWAQSRPFKMLLPVYPYVLTLGAIFIPGVPIPAAVGTAIGAKILFALWCGWLSDKAFEIVKRVLEKGFNMQFGADKPAK